MKKILSVFLAVVMLLSTMAIGVSAADFKDTTNHWGAEHINYWTAENAVGGYQDGSFRPDNSVTRGEVAQIIAKILKLTPTTKTSPFADMATDAWYFNAILACYEAGIFKGFPDKTIRANDAITREQAIVLISRITNVTPNAAAASHFVDNKEASSWATAAIGALFGAGVLDGYKTAAGVEVRPQATVTRAEFLKLLATVDKASNVGYTVGTRKTAAQEETEPDQPIIIPAIASSATSSGSTFYKAKVEIRDAANAEKAIAAEYINTKDLGTTPILTDIYKYVNAKRAQLKTTFADAAAMAEMDAIIAKFVAGGNKLEAADLEAYAITYQGDAQNRGISYFLGATYKSLGFGTYAFTHTVEGSGNTYVVTLTVEKA